MEKTSPTSSPSPTLIFTYEPFKARHYMTVKARIYKKTFNPRTNSTEVGLSKEYTYIPCAYLGQDDPTIILLNSLIDNPNPQLLLCPDFKAVENDVTISSDPENLSSTHLNIKIYPCSLPDKNECYPVNKIFGANVNAPQITKLLSPSNYQNPIALVSLGYVYHIDITRTKSSRYTLHQTKILDDRHFYKKPGIREEYGTFTQISTDTWPRDMTQLHCTPAMIDAGDCEEYFDITYEMTNELVIIKRRYKKIPVLMGEIGGVLKILTSIFLFLSFYYSKIIKSFLFEKAFKIKFSTLIKVKKNIMKKYGGSGRPEDQTKRGSGNVVMRGGRGKTTENKKDKKNFDFKKNQFFEDVINSKTDVVELVKKMNLVDVLSKVCLKKHHRTLLPLLLLKVRQTSDAESRNPNFDDQKGVPKAVSQPPANFNNELPPNEDGKEGIKRSPNQVLEKREPHFSDYRRIYEALKRIRPRNSIEKIFNSRVLRYLSTIFEQK